MASNSLFTIPVGDLLASYSGDSKSFSFSGEIFDGVIDDISFGRDLSFAIEMISVDSGIEVVFKNLETEITYEGKKYPIQIGGFERTFKSYIDPMIDGDDVRKIEGGQIDLGPVIREELIMSTYTI